MTYLDYCLAHHDWLLEFIEALVAIESPSDDPAGSKPPAAPSPAFRRAPPAII
jgi:hypothetical protein